MDSGVYNRSLFRKRGTEARDQLKRMGGIMASSPELLQAAMQDQPPMPGPAIAQPQTGQGRVQFMAPNLLQPLQPQPQQPMQPMQQAPQPQPRPQQPPQPQQKFQEGGEVSPSWWEGLKARSQARLERRQQRLDAKGGAGGSVDTPTATAGRSAPNSAPMTFDRAVQVGANPAAALPQSGLPEDLQAKFAEIDALLKDPEIPDEQKAKSVLDSLGLEAGDNTQEAMRDAVSRLGLNPTREARIDDLNKAMLGFAIAAGDSPRASENIANGMLAGLKQIRDTEIRRGEAEREVAAAELRAMTGGGAEGVGSRDYRHPADTYQDIYLGTVNNKDLLYSLPEGVSLEDYATQRAVDVVRTTYTPAQLRGTAFEYLAGGAPGGSPSAPTGGLGSSPDNPRPISTQEDFDSLGPNEWYVDTETGQVNQKPGG